MWVNFSFIDTEPDADMTNRLKRNFVSFVSGPAYIMQKQLNVKNCQPGN